MEAQTATHRDNVVTPPVEANPPEAELGAESMAANIDQAPNPKGASNGATANENEDVVDVLVPKKEPKTWTVGPEGAQRQYVQRPLGFLAKMQWFSLVGEVLDKALSGEQGISLNNLFSAPDTRSGSLGIQDFANADTFVQAVGKLLVYAPDFLEKSYCIWLSVPDYERDLVKELMALPPEQGGLTDDDGIEIIETFIDQNYEALDSFFREKLGILRRRVQDRQNERNQSQQSKR